MFSLFHKTCNYPVSLTHFPNHISMFHQVGKKNKQADVLLQEWGKDTRHSSQVIPVAPNLKHSLATSLLLLWD